MPKQSTGKKTPKKAAKKSSTTRPAVAKKPVSSERPVAKKAATSARPAQKKVAASGRLAAKTGAKKGATSARPVAKKAAASRRPARKSAPERSSTPRIRQGLITHTELASADPTATREWCATVLGWQFGEPMPSPAGPYHMWRFENETGGGIRANNPPEGPGSIPYCEVNDIRSTYADALEAGAAEMLAPQQLPGGMGWIAIVAAPGGVPIGFWAMG